MNQLTIVKYIGFLDSLSQSDFERIKSVVLSSRIRFIDLDVGEIVCPIAEEVRDKVLCSDCPLRSSCPNFII
jgi:hypothetical protein